MYPKLVVSIPHWFSLNRNGDPRRAAQLLAFPSHIGSRSTESFTAENLPDFVGFHPTLVLAQPVSGRLSISIQRFHPTLVLAQREQARRDKASGILFPSHIGSRSTNMADGLFGEVQEFPSHIGSRSTVYRWATGPAAYLSFPSHIGSRSTNQPARKRFGYVRFHPTLVLAQLSRTILRYTIPVCFHPTLVLAQHW